MTANHCWEDLFCWKQPIQRARYLWRRWKWKKSAGKYKEEIHYWDFRLTTESESLLIEIAFRLLRIAKKSAVSFVIDIEDKRTQKKEHTRTSNFTDKQWYKIEFVEVAHLQMDNFECKNWNLMSCVRFHLMQILCFVRNFVYPRFLTTKFYQIIFIFDIWNKM